MKRLLALVLFLLTSIPSLAQHTLGVQLPFLVIGSRNTRNDFAAQDSQMYQAYAETGIAAEYNYFSYPKFSMFAHYQANVSALQQAVIMNIMAGGVRYYFLGGMHQMRHEENITIEAGAINNFYVMAGISAIAYDFAPFINTSFDTSSSIPSDPGVLEDNFYALQGSLGYEVDTGSRYRFGIRGNYYYAVGYDKREFRLFGGAMTFEAGL